MLGLNSYRFGYDSLDWFHLLDFVALNAIISCWFGHQIQFKVRAQKYVSNILIYLTLYARQWEETKQN